MHDQPSTAERIEAYRSRHVIAPEKVEDPHIGPIWRCRIDALRVHPRRGTGWYHDPEEVRILTSGKAVV